jgi:GAF domain-containing protein
LPEDRFEGFLSVPLLSRGWLVGVINLQHRGPRRHTDRQIRLISTMGLLVGAEIELARLESENLEFSARREARKILDRAKGIMWVLGFRTRLARRRKRNFTWAPTLWWSLRIQMSYRVSTAMGPTACHT